jgi:hypothetical protein
VKARTGVHQKTHKLNVANFTCVFVLYKGSPLAGSGVVVMYTVRVLESASIALENNVVDWPMHTADRIVEHGRSHTHTHYDVKCKP